MPLTGGATDKIGNRYECLWTIDCLLDLIDEKADNIEIEYIGSNNLNEQATAIRLEPVGEEGEGVEFWLQRQDIREYHQVKRQNTKGRWRLADLEGKQILTNFKKKLKNNQTHCYFISINNAYQLEELAERARSSQSWIEFVGEFLDAKDWRESFSNLVKYWHQYQQLEIEKAIDDFKSEKLSHQQQDIINIAKDSYEKLKRVYVETISERKLRQTVTVRLKSLMESKTNDFSSHTDYETAVDILAGLALDSIHKTLTASDIWKHLDDRGYQRCNYSKNSHILAAIDNANQLYLSPLEKQTVIAGQTIPREEVEKALELLLNTEDKKGVLLIGEAGVGKSGVMLQITKKLEQENISFFVFRIDNLSPEVNPDEIGRKYGLPHSPASVLGNLSKHQNRYWILIVDQLDAVSQVSGRNPQFFYCIHSLLEQTKQFSQVRVLVACRKFDLDNDSRIKNLIGKEGILETVEIKRLSDEQVKETVQSLGLDASKLNQKQIDLLSLPLHLGLLAEIYQEETIKTLNFETANDLFDKFWEFKQTKLYGDEKIKHLIQWNQVIDKICDNISTKLNQTLSISKYLLDDYLIDIRIMISENVLIQEQDKIKFFHESFFDYAFARRFIAREKQLLSFLREDEQHLFKRAQVRQILNFERLINFNQYLDNIKELLNSEDIRFHIKQLVISLLSNLENPTEEEWEIIQPFMIDNNSTLVNHAWRILYQPQWFMLAKNLGIIEQWLRDNNDLRVDSTVRLISFISKDLPDEVPPLIEPFIENSSEKWLNRFLVIAGRIELYLDKSRNLLDLFLTLLNKGKLDNLRDTLAMNGDFWSLTYSISEKNSPWTCEIIGHYLNRRLELYLMQICLLHWIYQCFLNNYPFFLKQYTQLTIRLNPFDTYGYNLKKYKGTIPDTQHTEIFIKSADKAPKDYVVNVLPFMLSVIELTSIKDDEKPYKDNVWVYRSYGRDHSIESAILEGMEIALSNLAKNNPEEFTEIIQKYNLDSSDYETVQSLLECAYQFKNSSLDHKIDLTSTSSIDPDNYLVKSPIPDNATEKMTDEQWIKAIDRGSAVEAITQLIFKDKERRVYFQKDLQQMVKDPSIPVRSCVAHALTAVLNYDRDLAINLFKELVDTEDILLSTRTVDRFLYYALQTHYTDLKLIVERMINSEIPEVQEVGARGLFLVSLINSEAQLLAENYLSGKSSTPAHRKAAALIYIANLRQAEYREFCENQLIELFNDPNEEVREESARFFSNLEPQDLTNYPKMIEAFINSSVFLKNSFHLLRLFTTIDKFDEKLGFKVCQRFVNVFLSEGGDRNGGYSNQLKYVSQIIIQIYSQTRDSNLQSSCLDVIDNLYRYRVYGLDKATEEYDR